MPRRTPCCSLAALGAIAATAVACAGAVPAAKAPEKCPPQNMTIALIASPRVNPTQQGDPRPVVVRVYQLKADARLLNAKFEQVWNDEKTTLGDDIVKMQEVEVYPSSRTDAKLDRVEGANHLAAVALFQTPTGKSWFASFDLPAPPDPAAGCYGAPCEGEECDERPVQNPVLAFWLDGAKIDEGVEHVEEYPRPGRYAQPARRKPELERAGPERRP